MKCKSEVQHNMFLLIYPEWYFKQFLQHSKLIKKIDIKEVYKTNEREHRNDRNPIYTIIIKMRNGNVYTETYEHFGLISLGIEKDPEIVRDERFKDITKQLSQV